MERSCCDGQCAQGKHCPAMRSAAGIERPTLADSAFDAFCWLVSFLLILGALTLPYVWTGS